MLKRKMHPESIPYTTFIIIDHTTYRSLKSVLHMLELDSVCWHCFETKRQKVTREKKLKRTATVCFTVVNSLLDITG